MKGKTKQKDNWDCLALWEGQHTATFQPVAGQKAASYPSTSSNYALCREAAFPL